MKERGRKRVKVIYFKRDGEMYRIEEEFTVGVYSQDEIIKEVLGKVRYREHDLVILDGEDGVRPYIEPRMVKAERLLSGSRGFGRY